MNGRKPLLDHTPALMQPQQPVEPLRRLWSRWRRFPAVSRVIPDSFRPIPVPFRLFPDCRAGACSVDSRRFPDGFPGVSRLDMLQLLAYPGKGVHIHPVIWASVPAVAAQRSGRFHHRKECLRWSEVV